tara:strand:+ start:388 stop:792 length:405 start_codon:yes stop_codon:yes gene_type:complete
MSQNNNIKTTPRVRVIQKLYSFSLNPDQEIIYNKGQYKKFIKDIVTGTIERDDQINESISKFLKEDINFNKTDKILKMIISAATFELMFKHNNPIKVIIVEYLKAAEFFLENNQIKYLNAILDKLSKNIRTNDN